MSFEPSPLTANANVQLDIEMEPKLKDSCKCFCCIPVKEVVKAITPRRKKLSNVEIKTEFVKTEIIENIEI